jgi:hypothetical protein
VSSPVRGWSMDEVESERADRLREDASGGVPFPPCLNCRFSAYITCAPSKLSLDRPVLICMVMPHMLINL